MKKIYLLNQKRLLSLFFLFPIIYSVLGNESRSVTFFVTSDIHGNIESKDAGILRLSTVLKREITNAGGIDKSILIDCGDFSQGSVEASLTKGKIIFDLLHSLNYEIIVPGNHDFDYGVDSLIANQKNILTEILCGNLSLTDGKNPFNGWKIINKNKLKVAIVGLTYPGGRGIGNDNNVIYKTNGIYDTMKNVLPKVIVNNPDIIVLVIHGGLYNSGWILKNVLRKFPEIDIVFAGHTHEENPGKLLYNNTYFVQAGAYGKYLGKTVIRICDGKKEINSQLIPVSGANVDLELINEFKSALDSLEIEKEKNIVSSKCNLDINNLAMDAMLKQSNADIAILGLSEFSKAVKGNVRYDDIFYALPYEDTMATMIVNKDELKDILQELYDYMKKKKKYKKVCYSGFSVEKTKRRISDIKFSRNNIDKEKINLVFSSYYVEYPGNKFPVIGEIAKKVKSKYNNRGILIRNALIELLQNY